jgi:hypothetical protein
LPNLQILLLNWFVVFCQLLLLENNILNSNGQQYNKIDFCGPDNPCRAKKNTNNFFIGNFTILTQLCDFFVVF